LITVYEIKPEAEGDPNSIGGRDVFVEIVASPEDALMRNSLTSDGTLLLESTENIPVGQIYKKIKKLLKKIHFATVISSHNPCFNGCCHGFVK